MYFALTVARQHDGKFDVHPEEFIYKKEKLRVFINELIKSKYSKPEDIEMIYRLFGAAFHPPNKVTCKKIFWTSAIKYQDRKIPFLNRKKITFNEDENFLDIVGRDKYEFKTLEDINLIRSEIDGLIQSIFICQRFLGPKHKMTIRLLNILYSTYKYNQDDKCDLLAKYIKQCSS